MRQDYSLFRRGNGVWYFMTYDRSGSRIKRSTGEKIKYKAIEFIEKYLNDEKIEKFIFRDIYSTWFDKDTCPYYREKKRDGKILSASYMRVGSLALNNYILPYWGDYELSEIRPALINEWKYYLLEEKELSGKTVGTYLSYLSLMLDWAWRQELIDENPCKRVKLPKKNSKERGILTREEAKRLFSQPWKNDTARLGNYLAMITGMRAGEIVGLRKCDISVKDGFLRIEHSFDWKEHTLGETKTRKTRFVPIPKSLALTLLSFNNGGEDAYVFSHDGVYPVSSQSFRENLQRELKEIGIGFDEQRERGLCFHSWRHFLNSQLRVSGVPDLITKEITGHATEAMMEHYTHLSKEDMAVVGRVQLELVANR